MFEQSLYNQELVATPLQEGDLFHNYEITNWELSPRIYKILGAAALANVFALFVFAQTSLLTMKGCDSPLVGRVCQVLDTVYVGSMLFGTEREYVDAVYDKTELGNAEITFVDVSGITPPLSYPEGYFQLANPVEYQAMVDAANNPFGVTDVSGIPAGIPITTPSTGGSLIDTTPNPPKTNPKVVVGDLPSAFDSPGVAANPNPRKDRRGGGVASNKDEKTAGDSNSDGKVGDSKTDPAQKVDPTAPVAGIDINKRPFVDLANNVNELLAKKELNLETKFLVNAKGKLTKEGKLDPKTFKYLQTMSTDENMIKVVQEGIEAINDSGYLQYLSGLSGKDFNLVLQQDEVSITAIVQSEMENDNRAKTIKSGLDGIITIAKIKKAGENADQNDKDDLILLENAKIEVDGKKLLIKFLIPKDIAQKMIQRKLAEQAKEPKQPSGNAITASGDNTAKK